MKREDAIELANLWYDMAGHNPNVGPAYAALQRAARQLLPPDVTAGGVAVIDDIPTMLALSAGGLFLAHATLNDDGRSTTVSVKRLPVVADRLTIELTDGLAGKRDGRDAVMRRWRFVWPDGTSVEFEAVAHVYAWNEGPDSAELLARAVAASVGWTVPSSEADAADND